MKKGNFIAAAVFAALAIYVIVESSGYPAGRRGVPGPAFFPTAIAVVMLMAALSLVITTLRMKPNEDKPLNLGRSDCRRVYLCMAVLLVYTTLVPVVGFCTMSSVMLFAFIKWFGRYKFHYCAISAIAITGIVYFVFNTMLNVPFRFGVLL